MKVMHIESGLGNQMLSYCEYLAMKKMNPDDDIYIENIIYEIPEANDKICQWNGYELNRIFGIEVPNVKTLFSEQQWERIIANIKESQFWERNWNYPVIFTEAFRKEGLDLKNIRGNFESPGWPMMSVPKHQSLSRRVKNKLERFLPYIYLQQFVRKRRQGDVVPDFFKDLFIESEDNLFSGQRLTFKMRNSHIDSIEDEVRQVFTFPKISDEKNNKAMDYINSHNSVAIHARRGDMLGYNYAFYVTGYFKRSVQYIRNHTDNPVFFIFCDPGSVQWAKENADVLGLDFKKDEIHFVDWNKSTNSFRDMQLMAACKHQVITNSSFGWWGAWLNTNPDKITCSPDKWINTTHSF